MDNIFSLVDRLVEKENYIKIEFLFPPKPKSNYHLGIVLKDSEHLYYRILLFHRKNKRKKLKPGSKIYKIVTSSMIVFPNSKIWYKNLAKEINNYPNNNRNIIKSIELKDFGYI